MRKFTVELKVVVEVEAPDSEAVSAVLSEMDYSFNADGAALESEIIDWEIKE